MWSCGKTRSANTSQAHKMNNNKELTILRCKMSAEKNVEQLCSVWE